MSLPYIVIEPLLGKEALLADLKYKTNLSPSSLDLRRNPDLLKRQKSFSSLVYFPSQFDIFLQSRPKDRSRLLSLAQGVVMLDSRKVKEVLASFAS